MTHSNRMTHRIDVFYANQPDYRNFVTVYHHEANGKLNMHAVLHPTPGAMKLLARLARRAQQAGDANVSVRYDGWSVDIQRAPGSMFTPSARKEEPDNF